MSTRFFVDQHNGRHEGRSYWITPRPVMRGDRAPFAPSTLEGARQYIRNELGRRKVRLAADLAALERELQNFDALYPASFHRLEDEFRENRAAIVSRIAEAAALRTTIQLGRLQIDGEYMNERGLMVFSVPEHGPIAETLSDEAAALLRAMLADAGLTMRGFWNGAGCWSMSVRYSVGTAVAA